MNQMSPWYRTQKPSAVEPALCGSLAIAAQQWVDERLADGVFTRIARRHDSDWPAELREQDWYSVRTVQQVVSQVLRFDEPLEVVMAELASRCVSQLMCDEKGRPTEVLERSDQLLHRIVNFGVFEAELNMFSLFEGWVHEIPCDLEAAFRGLWEGVAPAMLRASGVKESCWRVVQCEQHGPTSSLFLRCRYR